MKTIKLIKTDNKKFKLMGSGEVEEINQDYYEIHMIENIKRGTLWGSVEYTEHIYYNYDADAYWLTHFMGGLTRITNLDIALKLFDMAVKQYSSNNGTETILKSVEIECPHHQLTPRGYE